MTSAGAVLYQNLKQHIDQINTSVALAKRISQGEDRTIKIAHSSSIIMDHHKLQLLDQLCENHKINIEINTLSSEAQIDAILNGEIDIGFIRPPVYHDLSLINSISLYQAPLYVAVLATDAAFIDRSTIDIDDLKDFNFVSTPHAQRGGLSYLVANLCLSHGFFQKRSRVSSRKLSQLDLVAHGFGICIVPEEFGTVLPQQVKLLAIENQSYQSEVRLIWKKDHDRIIENCTGMIQQFYHEDHLTTLNPSTK